ncbi:MAG: dinitrogenase iron-molybdenum cofactor biosynthesis protein [Peptococcaceae bacterium BRH_c4b]|nr:MAG: dinitrogenase iron-molybdenum cofactor biosynthesis protein [Peptococcaceae bacterium BRH_c4b]
MKVAISSRGQTLDSMMEPRFGRCSWFVVVDTGNGEHNAYSNEINLSAAQGAGIQAAQNVTHYGVEAVITGQCGPKAYKTLKVAGIKIFSGADGTVSEALEKLNGGLLEEAGEADVEGHWM